MAWESGQIYSGFFLNKWQNICAAGHLYTSRQKIVLSILRSVHSIWKFSKKKKIKVKKKKKSPPHREDTFS